MLRHRGVVVVLVVLSSLIACGGPSAPASTSSSTPSNEDKDCTDLLVSASAEVSRVVRANDSCKTSADCIYVDLTTDCRDACVGAVARSGLAAIEAAKSDVDRKQCAIFRARGCKKSPIPPCAPPLPPECSQGHCV